jgi:hypothetical protein
MVIRRIREHAASYNWFAVAVDLAIVIIGVFIGIQASNWNAARIERGEVRAYRAQIIENLKANEREIANGGRYYRQVREHALATLRTLEGNAPRDEAFLIHSYQASQYWPVRMESSAYDEMIASGVAKSFGDASIRRQLSSYYAGLRQFQEAVTNNTAYRERIRRALPFSIQQQIRERCSDVLRRLPSGAQHATLPDQCALHLPDALVTRALARVEQTNELDQDLTRHLGDLEQKIGLFDRLLRRTHGIRTEAERPEA